jgi:hypothetical protein
MTGYYNTFVVKIWCNEKDDALRGYIQHVRSQERVYFMDMKDMADFMQNHLDSPFSDIMEEDNTERWAMVPDDFGEAGYYE